MHDQYAFGHSTAPRDPLVWALCKHAALGAVAAMAVLFALVGDRAPVLAGAYAATALLLVGMFVVVDRLRFLGRFAPVGDLRIVADSIANLPVAGHAPHSIAPQYAFGTWQPMPGMPIVAVPQLAQSATANAVPQQQGVPFRVSVT